MKTKDQFYLATIWLISSRVDLSKTRKFQFFVYYKSRLATCTWPLTNCVTSIKSFMRSQVKNNPCRYLLESRGSRGTALRPCHAPLKVVKMCSRHHKTQVIITNSEHKSTVLHILQTSLHPNQVTWRIIISRYKKRGSPPISWRKAPRMTDCSYPSLWANAAAYCLEVNISTVKFFKQLISQFS